MKIYSYTSKLNESKNLYLVKDRSYVIDGRKTFSTPKDLVNFLYEKIELHNYAEEYVYSICLDKKLHIIGCFEVSHGTVDGSFISPREIFQKALMIGVSCISGAHNHPSGDPTPSHQDIASTRKLAEAGEVLDVPVIDHLIIGCDGNYYSFKEMGVI